MSCSGGTTPSFDRSCVGSAGSGAAWVSDQDGTITRIDAGTLQSTRITIDGRLAGVAVDSERETIWALVA